MSPQEPTSQTPQPLGTEERALAERLARLGPYGEPSPALDSRVLSAAHAAVQQRAADSDARRKPRVGWFVNMGIAASLVIALGLAWQLRPLRDTTVAYRSAADSALGGEASEAKQESRPAERQMVPLPMAIPQKPAPAADMASKANRDAGDDRGQAASVSPPPAQPPAVITHEQKSVLELKSPPPPPAPPAPESSPVFDAPAPVAATDARAFSTGTSATETAVGVAAQSSARLRKQAEARDKASAVQTLGTVDNAQPEAFKRLHGSDAAANDMPYEDVPPATVASPIVREAWLARIRELAGDGRIDEARASLHEFHVRYPHSQLPDDLRALEQKTGKPSAADAATPDNDTKDP